MGLSTQNVRTGLGSAGLLVSKRSEKDGMFSYKYSFAIDFIRAGAAALLNDEDEKSTWPCRSSPIE